MSESSHPAKAPEPASLEIVDSTGRLPPGAMAWLHARAPSVLEILGCSGELRVRIVDDAEMARAHERFSGVPGTTDVLTFDLTGPKTNLQVPSIHELTEQRSEKTRPGRSLDADVLVCLDVAHRYARPNGYAVERELLLYIVHAVLHCLGMDDHDEAGAAAMHRMEDAILGAIGVGAVFGDGGGGSVGA